MDMDEQGLAPRPSRRGKRQLAGDGDKAGNVSVAFDSGSARSRFVIIGGGIAGTTTASTLALLQPDASITVITASPGLKIATNVRALTSTGAIEQFDIAETTALSAPHEATGQPHADVSVVHAAVREVRCASREVVVVDGRVFPYDSLGLCSGARPHVITGRDGKPNPYVIGIRDTESVADLSSRLSSARRVVVVGNGGIAMELIYALRSFRAVVWCVKDSYLGNTFLDKTASAFLMSFLFPESDPGVSVSDGKDAANFDVAMQAKQVDAGSGVAAEHAASSVSRPREPTAAPLTIIDADSAWSVQSAWPIRSAIPTPANTDPAAASSAGAGSGSRTHVGGGLGPRWLDHLPSPDAEHASLPKHMLESAREKTERTLHASGASATHNLTIEFSTNVVDLHSPTANAATPSWVAVVQSESPETAWPVYVRLSDGKAYGADFVVSATGVVPNVEYLDAQCKLGLDGGVAIDDLMRTSQPDIFAAGDCAFADFGERPHWFQMRLWSQARQMGHCCARSMAGDVDELEFSFDLFTHVTKFFGLKVVLLGRFNGQGLGEEGKDYQVVARCKPGVEYVKLVVAGGKVQGATLVGDTDLEETFENLIMNQLDVSRYGDELLDPDVDLEDYFD